MTVPFLPWEEGNTASAVLSSSSGNSWPLGLDLGSWLWEGSRVLLGFLSRGLLHRRGTSWQHISTQHPALLTRQWQRVP